MGPLATAEFFRLLIALTDAEKDQDHLTTLIYNQVKIPDRTKYILGEGANPLPLLKKTALALAEMGADYLCMPCNTAHYFFEELKTAVGIPFLNMLELSAQKVLVEYGSNQSIGLLATEGTIKTGIYEEYFVAQYLQLLKPSTTDQKVVNELIEAVKAGKRHLPLEAFLEVGEKLHQQGATVLIAGCTEISVALRRYDITNNFIDPLEVLAEEALDFAGMRIQKF